VQEFLIVQVPAPLLAVVLLTIAVGASLGTMWIVRRKTTLATLEAHKEVAGFIIAVVGALYSVLLAFVVAGVWDQFERAADIADQEAELAISLYRDAEVFTTSDEVRSSLRAYAASVIDDEFPAMAHHQEEADATDVALADLFHSFRSIDPQGPGEEVFHGNALDRLDELTIARRERIAEASKSLPGPLWLVLVVGAVITVGFTLFLPVQNVRAQALMVSSLAALAALLLFLVLSLDLPYCGDLAVSPAAMQDAVSEFDDLDELDRNG
jgi:hypothetical protein